MAVDAENRQDDTLVRAFQEGDATAFDALVNRHQGRIFNLCFRMLGDFDEANDLAQETFIKAFKGLNRFRMDASFATWLYRIAVNTCRNRLNSWAYRFRKKTVSIEGEAGMRENPGTLQLTDSNPLPSDILETREKAVRIQKEILGLSADQRAVILLRDIEGLTYEEISAVIGENLGTVKSRLSRARQNLKERLRSIL